MKRYIDENTGKIVNILEKDEANKIVKILIDYFFSGVSLPSGRLNLVGYLRDFIKLGDIEDLNKIVEYIGDYKKTLKLSKEDEENFEVLYKFFRMYKDLEDAKLGIEDATNYISEMTNKKEELAKKGSKDIDKKDKILKVFFDNGFEFKRLAKVACDAWENNLKEQMNSGKKEIYVSLEQEIAYQDLLEFANSENSEISKNITTAAQETQKEKNENKAEVKTEIKSEVNTEVVNKAEEKSNQIDINVQIPEKKEPVRIEIETKKEEKEPQISLNNKIMNDEHVENVEKKTEKIPMIQINHLVDDENEMISNSNFSRPQNSNKSENTVGNQQKITQDEINSLLGLDGDLSNNSNSSLHKETGSKKAENSEKKEEKIPTIQINHYDDVKKENQNKSSDEITSNRSQMGNEERSRREPGYTSNIHIFVPGVDDEKERNNINPSEVKKATENVNLKESVDFFNNVLDNRMSSKSSLLSDDDSDGFRD